MKLAVLQQRFFDTLWGNPCPELEKIITSNHANKRLDVYRNNVMAALIEALSSSFPTVKRIMGSNFFQAVARQYIETHKPDHARLLFFGKNFANFLSIDKQINSFQELVFIADIARIDYARIQAYHASESIPMLLEDLQTISPEDIAILTPEVNPSLALISSEYPIYSIWQENQKEEVGIVNLDDGAQSLVLMRTVEEVMVYYVSSDVAAFITCLYQGQSIGEIFANIENAEQALVWCTSQGVMNKRSMSNE